LSNNPVKISLIIVNLNTGNILLESVESLFKFETVNDSYEIIIVDQNSSDNSKEVILKLSEKYNNIKYIFNDSLESFSRANNQGFEISSGEYILIMNPDIIFVEPVINRMIKVLSENQKIGAVCPLLIGKNGDFQNEYFRKYPSLSQFIFFYMVFSKPFYYSAKFRRRFYEIAPDILSGNLEYVEQLPCAFFFTTRNVFESSGKMDERYILFYEDVDLSYQINKSFKLVLDTASKIVHYGGSSFVSENNWWLYGRFMISMNYFFDKNYNFLISFALKILSVSNSLFIVTLEYIKSIFNKDNDFRRSKHASYLKEFKKVYLYM